MLHAFLANLAGASFAYCAAGVACTVGKSRELYPCERQADAVADPSSLQIPLAARPSAYLAREASPRPATT